LTSVLGYPLDRAIEALQSEGFRVETEEARSKKGVLDGTEQRVIRQSEPVGNLVNLVYALFKTEPNETND
jgi:beta-lactam-binding protein with PASTA domain